MNHIKDSIKEIEALENKYGTMLFRMALTHLVDVGIRNLTEENIEESFKQIMADEESNKANGVVGAMTPEFQYEILRCAAELAKFSIWDLFRYIKKYVHISE